jgi:predicted dehydrogenase
MNLRVGIAGVGVMGMIHYLAYERIRGVDVVALCSRNRRRLEGDWRGIRGNFGPAGKRMDLKGVRKYPHLDDLLADDQIDLIDITLPPALHAEAAIRAFEHGKHVFCEKPLALTAAECRRIVRAAGKAHRHLYVGHVLPYFSEYAWALKAVRSGRHGKLLGGSFKREIDAPKWVKNFWHAGEVGGPMLDLNIHDAHFIRLLFGMPLAVVSSGTMHRGLPEHWHSLFRFADLGFAVHASGGVVDRQGYSFCHGFEIHLQRATLKFEFAVIHGEGRYLCEPTIVDSRGTAKLAGIHGGDPMDAFHAELQEVVRFVTSDRPSEILSGDLALDAVTISRKQAASVASGMPVRI